jgi:hypothetical protein
MTRYINTETLEYPLTEYQVRCAFPNTSLPTDGPFAPPAPYAAVADAAVPAHNPAVQEPMEVEPALIDGVWTRQWLTAARSAVWEAIQGIRDELQVAGCPAAGMWFHNDVKSRSQWERMWNRVTAEGAADTDPYMVGGEQVIWKTMGQVFVPVTAGLIREVVAAIEVREKAIFTVAEYHNAMMRQAANPLAYDYSVGWPTTFEG